MSVIIFILILAVLILVHELGHFWVAKKSGIRVDEFGLGFPPRAWGKKIGETIYSINWIPFGGFVKIFGEDPNDESIDGPDSKRSFVNKNRGIQAAVLVAGVTFNFLFAWLLLSIGFMVGLPTPASYSNDVKDVALTVTSVKVDSPAYEIGLQTGDKITGISSPTGGELQNPTSFEAHEFFEENSDVPVVVRYSREGEAFERGVQAVQGLEDGRKLIGITMDDVGILKLPFFASLKEGTKTTLEFTKLITVGLGTFFADAFTGKADFSEVAGPVGIAGLVGEASDLGFVYLLSFTAIISLHLAIINLAPFPALDGGRLLFVAIETIIRRPINPKIQNVVNTAGFAILILLMIFVTYKDIAKLF